MKIDAGRILESIMESLSQMEYVKSSEIPNIDLYMDQVLTFMNGHLEDAKRYEDDKIMTKTMINNYAKNNLIPPPEKKKYSREHILLLIFVYYLKNILSIGDIQTLLHPITEKYFNNKEGLSLTDVYEEVFSLEKDQIDHMVKDIVRSYQIADTTFSDAPEEDREFLNQFSFIAMLSFDVYLKKQIIERMIDQISDVQKDNTSNKNKK